MRELVIGGAVADGNFARLSMMSAARRLTAIMVFRVEMRAAGLSVQGLTQSNEVQESCRFRLIVDNVSYRVQCPGGQTRREAASM